MSPSNSKLQDILGSVGQLANRRKRRLSIPSAEVLEARRLLSVTVTGSGVEGSSASITATETSSPGRLVGWTVDFGGGSVFTTFDNYNGVSSSINVSHTYPEEGSYSVNATATYESVDSITNVTSDLEDPGSGSVTISDLPHHDQDKANGGGGDCGCSGANPDPFTIAPIPAPPTDGFGQGRQSAPSGLPDGGSSAGLDGSVPDNGSAATNTERMVSGADAEHTYYQEEPQGTPALARLTRSPDNKKIGISNGPRKLNFKVLDDGTFKESFGYGHGLSFDSTNNQYILLSPNGGQTIFYGDTSPLAGLIKSTEDAGGNVTNYTYDGSNYLTEIVRTNTTGTVTVKQSYVYTNDGSGNPTNILLRTKTYDTSLGQSDGSISYSNVQQVAYTYTSGEVETATVENGAGTAISTSYYRYGGNGELKYYLSGPSYARAVAGLTSGTPQSASEADLAPYADEYFQYDGYGRVTTEVKGAGAGNPGTYTYNYVTNHPTANYNPDVGFNVWDTKAVVTQPDGTTVTHYYNWYGEEMLKVVSDGTHMWGTYTQYDSVGRPVLVASPSAVALPSSLSTLEAYDDLTNAGAYLNSSTGLITTTSYYSGTSATSSTAGSADGYISDIYVQQGSSGSGIHQEHFTYYAISGGGATVYPVAARTIYGSSDGSDARTTSYSYTAYSGTVRIKLETITYPTISSGQNGPGSADTESTYFDVYGRPIWQKDGDGHITYTAYDMATDAVVKTITDVNYSSLSSAEQSSFSNTGWSNPSGLNLVTAYQVDLLGRTTKVTTPASNVTYIVYNDTGHETRVYPGFNGTTTAGPIQVMRDYYPAANSSNFVYSEALTTSATPHLTSSVPDGTESIVGSNIQSLQRDFYNATGQMVWSDSYASFSGLTYSQTVGADGSGNPSDIGTAGTNFYRTTFGFDAMGRENKVLAPTGTINRVVYDGLGRAISRWVGTTDTHSGTAWTPSTNTGNMMDVEDDVYDAGGVGDSDLTQLTVHPGLSQADLVNQFLYDFRDRLVAEKKAVQTTESTAVHRPIYYSALDNLGGAIRSYQYDGDGVSLSDFSTAANTDAIPTPDASKVRALRVDSYDDQGRVYNTQSFAIDQSSGTSGLTDSQILALANLSTGYFYDHRSNLVATFSPGGLVTKGTYDGAERLSAEYTTDGGAVNNSNAQRTSWSDATSVSNDLVLSQSEYTYDGDGNVTFTVTHRRFDNDATSSTGSLGSPSSGVGARDYYVADYYDASDRLTDEVNVGTNGGSSYTRAGSVPSRSDTVLVTHTAYDPAGNAYEVTDPRNILTEYYFDLLGRTTGELDNSDGGSPAAGTANTAYTYDGDNNVLTMTANSASPSQTTQYVYGVGGTSGTNLFSNDLIAKVEYPIKSGGSAGQPDTTSSGSVSYSYDLLGEPLSMTDRNGTVHAYTYNVLGRTTLDSVTTLGSGVNGSVRALGYSYTALGLPYQQTSYSDSSATTVVNQVQDAYNGYGQLTTQYQEHSGSVSTSTSPKVQYGYSQPSGANYSRLSSITYPNGRVLDYAYNSGLDSDISRVSGISDDAGTGAGNDESYTYLGLDSIVQRADGNGVDLTYIAQAGDTLAGSDGGDRYKGLDRFGRVIDQWWLNTGTSTTTDRYQYGYDRDGNVLYKNNLVASSYSELYHANSTTSGDNATAYDKLNRITAFSRGTLSSSGHNGSGLDTVSTVNSLSRSSESYTLDAVGNWTSSSTDGVGSGSLSYNSQNQLVTGSPAYDNNGNTTTDDSGNTDTYDAWNRLISVVNGTTTLGSYTYDAGFNQIKTNDGTTTTDLYNNASGQAIEERQSGTVSVQYVRGLGYVNDLVLRDDNSTSGSYGKASSCLGRRRYYQQDANYDVTALTDASGAVKVHFVYDPYGQAIQRNATWSGSATGSEVLTSYLFQGGRYDANTLNYHFGFRDYRPTMGRWLQQDPAGYVNGANLYQFVVSDPTNSLDPNGTDRVLNPPDITREPPVPSNGRGAPGNGGRPSEHDRPPGVNSPIPSVPRSTAPGSGQGQPNTSGPNVCPPTPPSQPVPPMLGALSPLDKIKMLKELIDGMEKDRFEKLSRGDTYHAEKLESEINKLWDRVKDLKKLIPPEPPVGPGTPPSFIPFYAPFWLNPDWWKPNPYRDQV